MFLKRLLSKVNLTYQDSYEEQEYMQNRIPVVKNFLLYLLMTIALLLIPYSVRFFLKDLIVQTIISVVLCVVAVIFLVFKQKIQKYAEYIAIAYIFALLGLCLTVFLQRLSQVSQNEAFYMGSAFAFIQRLVGYNIIDFRFIALFHLISIILKIGVMKIDDVVLSLIVVALEAMTVLLSVKGEKAGRCLFHSLYKAKKDSLKFKHLLNEYFPNQMAVFSNDNCLQYINRAFKTSFRCDSMSEAKNCLQKLFIGKQSLIKKKAFFESLGINNVDGSKQIELSKLLLLLSQNINTVREQGMIDISIVEEDIEKSDNNKMEITNQENAKVDIQLTVQPSERTKMINPLFKKIVHQETENEVEYRKITEIKDQKKSLNKQKSESETVKKNTNLPDMNASGGSNIRDSYRNSSEDVSSGEEGRKRFFKAKIFLLVWDDAESLALMLEDVTKQKTITQLKLADKNKDLVLAMVSHELRTPLNGMLGLIDIIKDKLEEGIITKGDTKRDEITFFLNACRNSGRLLLNFINSILDLSQIKNSKLKLVYTTVSISSLLNEIKCLFDYLCLSKHLYLKIDVASDVPDLITIDKNRLSQILINLMGNAFKFTLKGGITISVSLESSDPLHVKFQVKDTGIGIKKEDQNKLFKLFGKLDQQDNKINANGVGLGLTISANLVALLSPSGEGTIHLESEPGKGSNFSFVVQCKHLEFKKLEKCQASLANIDSSMLEEGNEASILKKMTNYTTTVFENTSKLCTSVQLMRQIQTTTSEKEKKGIFDVESLQVQQSYPPKTKEKSQGKLTREKPCCLIVDDNPFNLMVARHVLEGRNYNVQTAINGKEAIDKVLEQNKIGKKFKFILMDCQMPVMDGYEATRILREMMNLKEIRCCPIIALTANNTDEEHERMYENAGMSGFISKPLQGDEIESLLQKIKESNK